MNSSSLSTPAELAGNIVDAAGRLRDDVDHAAERPPLFVEIREIRRSLKCLEEALRDPERDEKGDAC